jgi:hypothetical protein
MLCRPPTIYSTLPLDDDRYSHKFTDEEVKQLVEAMVAAAAEDETTKNMTSHSSSESLVDDIVWCAIKVDASPAFFDALRQCSKQARKSMKDGSYQEEIDEIRGLYYWLARARRGECTLHDLVAPREPNSHALTRALKVLQRVPELDASAVNDKGEQAIHVVCK